MGGVNMTKVIKSIIIGGVLIGALLLAHILLKQPSIHFNPDLVYEYSKQPQTLDVLYDKDKSQFKTIEFHYDGKSITELALDRVGSVNLIVIIKNDFNKKTFQLNYTVEDTELPVIEGSVDMEVNYGVNPSFDHIRAADVVDGELEVSVVGDYDVMRADTYLLQAEATDLNGNVSQEIFNLVVKAKPNPPTITKPNPEDSTKHPQKGPEITYAGGHIFVNKKHGLPNSYNPGENAQARKHLNEMIQTMRDAGLNVSTEVSGFRTYEYQRNLYNRYVKQYGVIKADTFAARPGYSDHQTGLTFDLKDKLGQLLGRADPLASHNEITWVADHAHLYGFVVRYPQGKEAITGYIYEPWHLRYLGSKDALKIYQSGLTMEEYFNIPGGDYQNE